MIKVITSETLKLNREFFEIGCLCIRDNKIIKQPKKTSDKKAVEYYEINCKCSRNYSNA
jgi:hypothetical protein